MKIHWEAIPFALLVLDLVIMIILGIFKDSQLAYILQFFFGSLLMMLLVINAIFYFILGIIWLFNNLQIV